MERFPLSFKTQFSGNHFYHIVLGVHCGGRFGALGISRRDDLMFKHLEFRTLADLVQEFQGAYRGYWHTLRKVKIGQYVSHDVHSVEQIEWKHSVLDVDRLPKEELRRELERQERKRRELERKRQRDEERRKWRDEERRRRKDNDKMKKPDRPSDKDQVKEEPKIKVVTAEDRSIGFNPAKNTMSFMNIFLNPSYPAPEETRQRGGDGHGEA